MNSVKTTTRIGVANLPGLADALTDAGFDVVSGEQYRQAAINIKNASDAMDVIFVGDTHQIGLRAWAERMSADTALVAVTTAAGGEFSQQSGLQCIPAPLEVWDLLSSVGLATPDSVSPRIGEDGVTTIPELTTTRNSEPYPESGPPQSEPVADSPVEDPKFPDSESTAPTPEGGSGPSPWQTPMQSPPQSQNTHDQNNRVDHTPWDRPTPHTETGPSDVNQHGPGLDHSDTRHSDSAHPAETPRTPPPPSYAPSPQMTRGVDVPTQSMPQVRDWNGPTAGDYPNAGPVQQQPAQPHPGPQYGIQTRQQVQQWNGPPQQASQQVQQQWPAQPVQNQGQWAAPGEPQQMWTATGGPQAPVQDTPLWAMPGPQTGPAVGPPQPMPYGTPSGPRPGDPFSRSASLPADVDFMDEGLLDTVSLGSDAFGSVIVLAAGKGGVGKTSWAIAVAQRAALAGYRVILIDGNVGQAGVDIRLRLRRANLPTIADAALTGEISNAFLTPTQINQARAGANLEEIKFGLIAAPPADQAGEDIVPNELYAKAIEYAKRQADLVVVDTQIAEAMARSHGSLLNQILVPRLRSNDPNSPTTMVMVSEHGRESFNKNPERLKEFHRAGIPQNRIMLLHNKAEAGMPMSTLRNLKWNQFGKWVGIIDQDPLIHKTLNAGKTAAQLPQVARVIDNVLLTATGDIETFSARQETNSEDTGGPAERGRRKEKRPGFFSRLFRRNNRS